MAIEDALREIRTQISQAQGRKARAEVELEGAQARKTAARATLKEFGVETTADAKAVLASLEAELETAVTQTQEALAEAGA